MSEMNDKTKEDRALDALIVAALRHVGEDSEEEAETDLREAAQFLTDEDRAALDRLGPDFIDRVMSGEPPLSGGEVKMEDSEVEELALADEVACPTFPPLAERGLGKAVNKGVPERGSAMKARIFKGSDAPDGYKVPCGFLLVAVDAKGEPMFDAAHTVAIQSDWDFPGTAAEFGFTPCECGATDGTVDCSHKTATAMMSAAYDYLCQCADDKRVAETEMLPA
jgi:hypothetical protein